MYHPSSIVMEAFEALMRGDIEPGFSFTQSNK